MKRSATTLTTLLASTLVAWSGTNPSFSEYPANGIYRGRIARPDFDSAAGSENFRTRIINGMKNGANFAGRYAVITFGCGTGCAAGYITNIATGEISQLPLYGEPYNGLSYTYQVDSTLLSARWYESESEECHVASYNFQNVTYKLVSKSHSKTEYNACFDAN